MASLYESSMGYGLVYFLRLASCSYSVSSETSVVYSHSELHYMRYPDRYTLGSYRESQGYSRIVRGLYSTHLKGCRGRESDDNKLSIVHGSNNSPTSLPL